MLTYDGKFDVALSSNNLVLYVNDVKAELTTYDVVNDVYKGVDINVGDVMRIEPLKGYKIDPTYGNNAISDLLTNTTLVFEVTPDGKSGSAVYDGSLDGGYLDYRFSTVTAPIDVPDDDDNPIDNIKKGVNNVYLIDATTARQVMNKSFTRITSDGGGRDYTGTIIGLINIPFTIDDKYKTGEQKIMLADFDTDLKGIELNTDTIIVDMGVISVPHLNDDFTDYEKAKVDLFLPYCDSITLNSNDVIGFDVSIKYWVNCYNGETLINIYSSKNNALIESKKVDLRVNVPFNKVENTPQRNGFNAIDSTGYNGVNTPYIEVKTLDSVLKHGLFTNPIIDEKTLADERGFIEVENIELTVNATLQEKSEILNLLVQGVIIK